MSHRIWNTTVCIWKIMFIHQPINQIPTYTSYKCMICRYDYCKRCSFLLPAGKRIKTAELAGKKKNIFSHTIKCSNVFISLISMLYRPFTHTNKHLYKKNCLQSSYAFWNIKFHWKQRLGVTLWPRLWRITMLEVLLIWYFTYIFKPVRNIFPKLQMNLYTLWILWFLFIRIYVNVGKIMFINVY